MVEDEELEKIKKRKFLELIYNQNLNRNVSGLRVCIPTLSWNGLDDYVCEHFGRAPTFTIVDLVTNKVEVIPNTSEHMGGSGLPPEMMRNRNVNVVICSNLGPRAIHMLEKFGIEVYVGAFGTVREAIQAWQSGKLQQATNETACRTHKH